MSYGTRMFRCGWCKRGIPDGAEAEPTKEDLATKLIDDANYHAKCLESARARAERMIAARKNQQHWGRLR